MSEENIGPTLGRRSRRQNPIRRARGTGLGGSRIMIALIIGALLISYSLNLPRINAYFTDSISFGSSLVGGRGLNSVSVPRLTFKVHKFTNLKVHLHLIPEEGILSAALNLPDGSGFDATDILRNSIELGYDRQPRPAMAPISLAASGQRLEVTFDWGEIEHLIGADKDPGFELTGKGSGAGESGRGERFIFSGHGQITNLMSCFQLPEEAPPLSRPEGIEEMGKSPEAGLENAEPADENEPGDNEDEGQLPTENNDGEDTGNSENGGGTGSRDDTADTGDGINSPPEGITNEDQDWGLGEEAGESGDDCSDD